MSSDKKKLKTEIKTSVECFLSAYIVRPMCRSDLSPTNRWCEGTLNVLYTDRMQNAPYIFSPPLITLRIYLTTS